MTRNPWGGIDPHVPGGAVNGKRVESAKHLAIYWALDSEGRPALLFRHLRPYSGPSLPKLHGLEVVDTKPDASGYCNLVLLLTDSEKKDIFQTLCEDIVFAAAGCETEDESVTHFVQRTLRWHHLLRRDWEGKLSEEEQRGLIGELLVLNELLKCGIAPAAALSAWGGPFDLPKDFDLGGIGIEVKTRRGAGAPRITISSEYQLDTTGLQKLLLIVFAMSPSMAGVAGSFTLDDVVRSTVARIASLDSVAEDTFSRCLSAAGYRAEDGYDNLAWTLGSTALFDVWGDFPRITPGTGTSAVSNVHYALDLTQCAPFSVSEPLASYLKTFKGANS